MKPSEITEALKLLITIKRPAFLVGEAGVGKSRICRQVTETLGMRLVDIRAVLLDPVDIKGLPHVNGDGRAHWATPDFLPREDDPPTVILLDEINRAAQMVQNSCLQLSLDRQVGDYRLGDQHAVIAAGNPDTHRGVTRMSEALASRFVHLPVEPDLDDWTKWAIDADMRPELIAFLRFRPELLHRYEPSSTEKAFPCPRSWEFVGEILNADPDVTIEHALYSGTVGEGPAAEFVGFLQVYRQLPSLDAILLNPKKADVPTDTGALFAIAAGLARKATDANFDRVLQYVDRMPKEYAFYCVKDAAARDQMVTHTKAFQRFAADNADLMG
jgi:hypothetical protein